MYLVLSNATKQVQPEYKIGSVHIILWHVHITILQWKHNHFVCCRDACHQYKNIECCTAVVLW